jgi:hypothetical protein
MQSALDLARFGPPYFISPPLLIFAGRHTLLWLEPHGLKKPCHPREPDDPMDVIRHQHEADAKSVTLAQLPIQHPQDNSLGMIVVQQTTATVDRKRNEVGIQSFVDNSPSA